MKLKQDQSWNHRNEEAIRRGAEGARSEPVDLSPVSGVVSKMMSEGRAHRTHWLPARYLAVAGVGAALIGVALYPRPSSAAMSEVVDAVRQQRARFEEVYKPDKNGKLYVYLEHWGKPGKYAMRFTDDAMESRENGKLIYCYWNTNGIKYQRVDSGEGEGIDPVGVEEFGRFKLLRVLDAGPHLKRYVFNIRQDLIVDTTTNLPTQRVCYNNDGSVMEIHVYHFQDVDDSVFEPHIKPGVPYYNIPADRQAVNAMIAQPPQTVVVAGVKVKLHAVIVDMAGNVGALVSGGDPRGVSTPMQVVGLPEGMMMTPPSSTVLSQAPETPANRLTIGGQPARLEKVTFPPKVEIPDGFTLRIPVWRYDPSQPLINAGRKIGLDSKIVGWAEFKVNKVLRTEQVEKVLPDWAPPEGIAGTGTAKADSSK